MLPPATMRVPVITYIFSVDPRRGGERQIHRHRAYVQCRCASPSPPAKYKSNRRGWTRTMHVRVPTYSSDLLGPTAAAASLPARPTMQPAARPPSSYCQYRFIRRTVYMMAKLSKLLPAAILAHPTTTLPGQLLRSLYRPELFKSCPDAVLVRRR
jgi:hypothetical protein